MSLNFFPEMVKNNVAHEGGNQGDHEIGNREYILNRVSQGLPLRAVGVRELPHQKVGIKEEDDETHLDEGP